jgi:SnoaL-like domain
MIDFPAVLEKLAAAVVANDGAALAALFTEDGVYDDGFFGVHQGPGALAAMLTKFHATGTNYRWDFFDPLTDGRIGYARYRFSFASKMRGAKGKPVVFEGMSLLEFNGDRIARYSEAFDRGVAFVQQDFPAEQVQKILAKVAQAQNATAECREHLARFASAAANSAAS